MANAQRFLLHIKAGHYHPASEKVLLMGTVDSEIFARILFSRIALKEILVI